MKIKFLGTSAGWPLPRLGCACQICTSNDPKDKRTRTQLLVNDTILLDAGPDTYNHLLNNKPTGIRHILISHTHPDHIMGLWDLSHIYNRGQNIDLILTQEVWNGLRKIPNFLFIKFNIRVAGAYETIRIDSNTTASYFPVEHGRQPTFGIKVKSGPVLVYIPDMSKVPQREHKLIKDTHLLAMDGSSLNKQGQARSHQSIEEGVKFGKEIKAQKVYFVHIGHATGKHVVLEDFVQKNGGKNFHIAYDGLELGL